MATKSPKRLLLQEGRVFLSYILKTRPDNALLRRYVQAIEVVRSSKPLPLPYLLQGWPTLITLIDHQQAQTEWQKECQWRLNAAMVLAEASPLGEQRFLGTSKHTSCLRSIIGITAAVIFEIMWRLLGFLATPMIKKYTSDTVESRS